MSESTLRWPSIWQSHLIEYSPRYWSQRLTDSLSGPANPYPRTPAMGAGVESHVWRIEEIVELLG